MMINKKWEKIIKKLDFAFQPIVDMSSGKIYAVEALLRNVKEAGGFHSIFSLFDEAFHEGCLYQLDLELRMKSFEKFSKISIDGLHLFYNIDNRILYMPDLTPGNTDKILKKYNLEKEKICFEISERGTLQDPSSVTNMVKRYKQNDFKIAIDDFGTGIAGFKMLYYSEANFIKIDRFFIQNIQNDNKKRLFCSHIINLSHIMGMSVIAEGIETKEEYYTCKEIGADLIQGYFAQKPQLDIKKIHPIYKNIKDLYKNDFRKKSANIINKEFIKYIEPLYIEELNFQKIFKYFKQNKLQHFVPIINADKEFKGIINEKNIRDFSYSQYGISLSCNDRVNEKLKSNIKKILTVKLNWSIDKILEIYNINGKNSEGIFVTKNSKYFGYLSLDHLLYLSYKRNIEIATDKNPLTKLPGNNSINNFLEKAFEKNKKIVYTIVYFDFNDFKPFNDIYGFRKGDRAIIMFSEILNKELKSSVFIGHIGGDDFFIGFKDEYFSEIYNTILYIQNEFTHQVSSLYTKEDREAGYIQTKDRFGIARKFDLLSVCAAIIEIRPRTSKNKFDNIIGEIKKESKKIKKPLAISIL